MTGEGVCEQERDEAKPWYLNQEWTYRFCKEPKSQYLRLYRSHTYSLC